MQAIPREQKILNAGNYLDGYNTEEGKNGGIIFSVYCIQV